ncbi:response regulator [Oricola cellulosilytica]|uniref:Response regulator n=1 Tax=Oricola cellulosilytica TaxID=1429082 RepID=A0A4V2MNR3_9HYPH|nr:response regulator [Oricola cellulosilytica]TCD14247.1 response regulator [Oricola cellulosilytica]
MTQRDDHNEILLVEDDAFIALDAEMSLEDAGYRIVAARSVSAALELLRTRMFLAAILDFDLGDETSKPIADKLAGKNIPFALVSGHDQSALRSEGFDNSLIFAKPSNYVAVAERLTGRRLAA